MNYESDFDPSIYEDIEQPKTVYKSLNTEKVKKYKPVYESDFDPYLYDEIGDRQTNTQQPGSYVGNIELKSNKDILKNKKENEFLSLSSDQKQRYMQSRKEEEEYKFSRSFVTGLVSSLTLGNIEIEESEVNSPVGRFVGEMVGDVPLLAATAQIAGPLFAAEGLAAYSPLAKTASVGAGLTGAAIHGTFFQTIKEVGSGKFAEEPIESLKRIGEEAGFFALFHGALRALNGGVNWIKSLSEDQALSIAKGQIPSNLDTTQYKYWVDKVYPEIQKNANQQSKQATEKAMSDLHIDYQSDMNKAKSEYDSNINEVNEEFRIENEAENARRIEHENKKKQDIAEHQHGIEEINRKNETTSYITEKQNEEARVEEIKKANEKQRRMEKTITRINQKRDKDNEAIADKYQKKIEEIKEENEKASDLFKNQNEEFENMKKRNSIVERFNEDQISDPNGPPFVRSPSVEIDDSIKNEVGNIIGKRVARNSYDMGKCLSDAIRLNSKFDHDIVDEAYEISKELNSRVFATHDILVEELDAMLNKLNEIPHPAPPQSQMILAIEDLMKSLVKKDPKTGIIIGMNPVSNTILQEQSKALRYFMDYHFEHKNTRGEFTPLVQLIASGVERAAIKMGIPEAAEEWRRANGLYREWVEEYDSDYIRPYRDTKNISFQNLYENALGVDNFMPINNILFKSSQGQLLSRVVKRSLVEKQLNKFFGKDNVYGSSDFDEAVDNLTPVISPLQRQKIREAFKKPNIFRRNPHPKAPEEPKVIELPKEPKFKERKIVPEKPPLKLPKPKEPIFKPLPTLTKVTPHFKEKTIVKKEVGEFVAPERKELIPTPQMKAAAKILELKPGDLMKMADTPDGLKELKELLSGSPNQKEIFHNIGKYKIRQILNEGKIHSRYTGKQLYEVLNKENNLTIVSEIIGYDEANELYEASKKINEQIFSKDKVSSILSHKATKALILYGLFF